MGGVEISLFHLCFHQVSIVLLCIKSFGLCELRSLIVVICRARELKFLFISSFSTSSNSLRSVAHCSNETKAN